jgi:hypothetical protein
MLTRPFPGPPEFALVNELACLLARFCRSPVRVEHRTMAIKLLTAKNGPLAHFSERDLLQPIDVSAIVG